MSLAAADARHAGETKRAVGRLAWNNASGGTQVLDIAVPFASPVEDRAAERDRFAAIRQQTEALAAHLTPEDQAIQSMPDVSPTKWHLAHTSWFFETFLLGPFDPAYRVFDPAFAYLFNSYYEAAGPRHPRPERGLLSRPTVDAVGAYRDHVTAAMLRLIEEAGEAVWHQAALLVELGLQHEQQHQELILMDIKHVFSVNPLLPAYQAPRPHVVPPGPPTPAWVEFAGGLEEIGHAGPSFAFDNEGPRHKIWLEPFRLAAHPVCCGDYLEFITEGGYRRPEFWLSDGWATVQQQGWQAPLYWRCEDSKWLIFTLSGDLVYETDFDGATSHGASARGVYNPRTDLDVRPPTLSGRTFGWNMITRGGQAAATGLYMYAVEDKANGDKQRGKFLIVKSDREDF